MEACTCFWKIFQCNASPKNLEISQNNIFRLIITWSVVYFRKALASKLWFHNCEMQKGRVYPKWLKRSHNLIRDQVKGWNNHFIQFINWAPQSRWKDSWQLKFWIFAKIKKGRQRATRKIVATILLQMGNSMQAVLSTPIYWSQLLRSGLGSNQHLSTDHNF